MIAGMDEAKEKSHPKELSHPKSEWKAIKEKTIAEYYEGFSEYVKKKQLFKETLIAILI